PPPCPSRGRRARRPGGRQGRQNEACRPNRGAYGPCRDGDSDMAFKLVEGVTPPDRVRAIAAIWPEMGANDVQVGAPLEDGRVPITILLGEIDRQALVDRLQAALGKADGWRITIVPTDTVIPREDREDADETEKENGKDEEESEESRE